MGFSLIKLMGSQFMPGSHNTIAASTIFSSKIVPSAGLAGVIGVQHMIHTCTRRFYHANFSQKFLNSAATTPSLNLWAQRCMRFCKRNKGCLLFGAFAACVTLSYVRIQRVPYTGRIQLVSNEKAEEKRAEECWNLAMRTGKDELLPLSDPRSVRAQSVAANVIRAMKVGLKLEKDCKINGHSCENPDFRDYGARHEWEGDNGDEDEDPVNRFEEVSIPFKEDHKLSMWKPSTKHLDGKDWEVYVADLGETGEDSFLSSHICHFNKRILIDKGLLDSLKSDAELAALIGHQIGHIVGRHIARIYVRLCWNLSCLGNLLFIGVPHPDDMYLMRFVELGWAASHRWNEREANRIGLMLMANAGYNPRMAYEAFQKMGQSSVPNLKHMEEAYDLYKKVNLSRICEAKRMLPK